MDGTGLDSFKHSLILGNPGDVCISSTKSTSVLTSAYVLRNPHYLKGEMQNNWPKLLLSVTRGAGPLELSVQKDLSLCGLSGSNFNSQLVDFVHLPKVRAFDVRKLFPSARSELWTSAHRGCSVDKPNTEFVLTSGM